MKVFLEECVFGSPEPMSLAGCRNLKPKKSKTITEWYVYIIRCSDDSLYTGISTDVNRRFSEHASAKSDKKGAKYFYARSPEKIVYVESGHTRSTASQRETAIKKLTRLKKLMLVSEKK